MNRDQTFTNIRHSILAESNPADDEVAVFQVTTLRPILKLQHDILVEIVKDYLNTKFKNFQGKNAQDQNQALEHALKTDQLLKQCLIACVVALFTVEEIKFYLNNKSESNKRLVLLLVKRLSGTR